MHVQMGQMSRAQRWCITCSRACGSTTFVRTEPSTIGNSGVSRKVKHQRSKSSSSLSLSLRWCVRFAKSFSLLMLFCAWLAVSSATASGIFRTGSKWFQQLADNAYQQTHTRPIILLSSRRLPLVGAWLDKQNHPPWSSTRRQSRSSLLWRKTKFKIDPPKAGLTPPVADGRVKTSIFQHA